MPFADNATGIAPGGAGRYPSDRPTGVRSSPPFVTTSDRRLEGAEEAEDRACAESGDADFSLCGDDWMLVRVAETSTPREWKYLHARAICAHRKRVGLVGETGSPTLNRGAQI